MAETERQMEPSAERYGESDFNRKKSCCGAGVETGMKH
jgi:hypothetical protein